MAKIEQFIYTEQQRGKGTPDDPVRACPQLWSLDGKLVAEHDPVSEVSWFRPYEIPGRTFNPNSLWNKLFG